MEAFIADELFFIGTVCAGGQAVRVKRVNLSDA